MASLVMLVFVYVAAWAAMADGGIGYDEDGGGRSYRRIPGHVRHGRLCQVIFAPAYAVDRQLRPSYWNWSD